MRLTNRNKQGLMVCLAALKQQQRCLARHMDEVRTLLNALETADEASVSQDNRSQRVRHYNDHGEHTASA